MEDYWDGSRILVIKVALVVCRTSIAVNARKIYIRIRFRFVINTNN